MSFKKRKHCVDVDLGNHIISRSVNFLERARKMTGKKTSTDLKELKKRMEDNMHNAVKRAYYLNSIEDLKEIQSQHDDVEAMFIKEKEALQAKYHKLYAVQFTKRCEVVNGAGHCGSSSKNKNIGGVPDFWLTVMKSNAMLLMEIKEDDEEALKLLKDIKLCRIDNPKGFKLEFYFADNSFFKNKILTKMYQMVREDDVVPKNIIRIRIEWYSRKRLTQAVRVTERGKSDSFFNFFNPSQVPDDGGEIFLMNRLKSF